jgi:hypothetical protein
VDGSVEFFRNQVPLGEASVIPPQYLSQDLQILVFMERANGIVSALPKAFGLETARGLVAKKKIGEALIDSDEFKNAQAQLSALGGMFLILFNTGIEKF